MGVRNDKKVTPGITELSRLRAHTSVKVANNYIGLPIMLAYNLNVQSRSTARLATSMSALPILAVQNISK